MGTVNSHIEGFYAISRANEGVYITPLNDKCQASDFSVSVASGDANMVSIKTVKNTSMRVIY